MIHRAPPAIPGVEPHAPYREAPAPAAEARAASASTPVTQLTERQSRAIHQFGGVRQSGTIVRDALNTESYRQAEIRTLAESQADTLYHRLTQTVNETEGLAATQRAQQIHQETGALALLTHYLGESGATAESARPLIETHTQEIQRLEPHLQQAPTSTDIDALNRLLGSAEGPLQRTPFEFAYHLVRPYRVNADEPAAAPQAPLERIGEALAEGNFGDLLHDLVRPAVHYFLESTSSRIAATVAAIDRGDTASIRSSLARGQQFIDRLRRPLEATIAQRDARSSALERIMNLSRPERTAALERLETEATQAQETRRRFNAVLDRMPPEAYNRISQAFQN